MLSQYTHTHLSLSLSLSLSFSLSLSLACSLRLLLSFCSVHGREEQRFNSVKHRCYVACFSNFTCKYSHNHSTAIVIILCVFDCIRRRLDYKDFCADLHLGSESWLCNLVLIGSCFNHFFIFIPLSDNRNSQIYQ